MGFVTGVLVTAAFEGEEGAGTAFAVGLVTGVLFFALEVVFTAVCEATDLEGICLGAAVETGVDVAVCTVVCCTRVLSRWK